MPKMVFFHDFVVFEGRWNTQFCFKSLILHIGIIYITWAINGWSLSTTSHYLEMLCNLTLFSGEKSRRPKKALIVLSVFSYLSHYVDFHSAYYHTMRLCVCIIVVWQKQFVSSFRVHWHRGPRARSVLNWYMLNTIPPPRVGFKV